jgi:hypothetical protein
MNVSFSEYQANTLNTRYLIKLPVTMILLAYPVGTGDSFCGRGGDKAAEA